MITVKLEVDRAMLEMVGVPVPGYQALWVEKRASLQAEYKVQIKQYSNVDMQYRHLFKILCNTDDVAGLPPAVVGESAEWAAIVSATNDNSQLLQGPLRQDTAQCTVWKL